MSASEATTRSDAPPIPSLTARWFAEAIGTFILVFGGVGTAVFAANFANPSGQLGVGFLGVALAFGLTVLIGVYAFGPVSGGHFNPAVTIGMAAAGRFAWKDVIGYIIAQLVGGIVASSLLVAIAAGGKGSFLSDAREAGFASNGYGDHSPGGFGMGSAIIIEVILTAVFLYVIIGTTSKRAPAGFAGIAIGLTLTLIHLISIPVDNTSVNPARSIAAALWGTTDNLAQVWLFIVFPIIGALIAGFTFRLMFDGTKKA